MTVLAVVVGAMVGAPVRYLTDLVIQSRHDTALPWGTVAVNVAGSLVLGVTAGALAGRPTGHWLLALVGTGFCGGLTTYSAFAVQVHDAGRLRGAAYAAASIVLGVAAASLGFVLGQA